MVLKHAQYIWITSVDINKIATVYTIQGQVRKALKGGIIYIYNTCTSVCILYGCYNSIQVLSRLSYII